MILYYLLVSFCLGDCSKGLYDYSGTCIPMCGDEIRVDNEECDGGSGCELNCTCAVGWKKNEAESCIPSSETLKVAFGFILELEKASILKENLFRYQIESEILSAYNYELKLQKSSVVMERKEVVVKALTEEQVNSKTIPVKFRLEGSSKHIPVYVDYFKSMLSNYSSFWYSQNSTYIRNINLIKPITTYYQVDDTEFNGTMAMIVMFTALLLFILI